MSALEFVALVLTAVWLLLLTVVTLVLVRQVAILTVRLNRTGPSMDLARDGLMIGSEIPPNVVAALPELSEGIVYLLMTSGTCAPCYEVVAEMCDMRIPQTSVALVAGPAGAASELERLFPSAVRTIRDPQASELAKSLELHSTPYVLELEDKKVTGKAFLHEAADLIRLIEAGRTPRQLPPRLTERKEVTTSAAK